MGKFEEFSAGSICEGVHGAQGGEQRRREPAALAFWERGMQSPAHLDGGGWSPPVLRGGGAAEQQGPGTEAAAFNNVSEYMQNS